ncbi:MAG: hypothetical protein JWL95_3230 [Gemmatimonadetes bacterium]|nr:hypothetical protein [Gemmatimonadota bacterium]
MAVETPNSFSEPPLAAATGYAPPLVGEKGRRASPSSTWPDVAMRLVNDGPIYGILILVCVLAMSGHASASESLIAALGTLLARSWPRAVQVAAGAAVVAFALFSFGWRDPAPAFAGGEPRWLSSVVVK